MKRFADKVALVTGAASGIGAATARLLADEGARVVVADLQEDAGGALAKELGASFLRTDVSQEAAIEAAVALALSEFGQLDVMVNNAGIVGAVGSIADTSVNAWQQTLDVLLTGTFLGMKHAARVMRPRGSGSIVSIASTAGITGGLGPHAYTAAKHAVVGLTKSVGSELAGSGIRVNAVAPGNTVTAMTAAALSGDHTDETAIRKVITAGSMLGIPGEPRDIAGAVAYLASDEARYITGHTLVVDAGQTEFSPPAPFHSAPPAILREAGRREDG